MILETLSLIFQVHTILYILLGVASGICIGCLPGLTATMGVALVLPLTFGMDAAAGILLKFRCALVPPNFLCLQFSAYVLFQAFPVLLWQKVLLAAL